MYRLLEYLFENDLFMSNRPDVEGKSMVFTFRKRNHKTEVISRSYRLTMVEINNLDVNIAEVLIDFAERFMDEFKKEQDKYW